MVQSRSRVLHEICWAKRSDTCVPICVSGDVSRKTLPVPLRVSRSSAARVPVMFVPCSLTARRGMLVAVTSELIRSVLIKNKVTALFIHILQSAAYLKVWLTI